MCCRYSSSTLLLPVQGTNPSEQLSGIIAHRSVFVGTVLNTIEVNGPDYIRGTVGILGWPTILTPVSMYLLPMIAVLCNAATPGTTAAVPLIGWWFHGEQVTPSFWVGMTMIVAGLLLTQLGTQQQ